MRDLLLVSIDMITDRMIQALDLLERRTRIMETRLEEIEARMIRMRNDKYGVHAQDRYCAQQSCSVQQALFNLPMD
jgi:hypothetical protein